MNKVCFMFGHRDTPDSILPQIERMVEQYYYEHDICEFVVGNRGNFDMLAAQAVRAAKQRIPEIKLTLLLAYPPVSSSDIRNYDSFFYPEGMESEPVKYAIVSANKRMVARADAVICFVNHGGNTAALLQNVQCRALKENVIIENLAVQE